MRDMVLPGLFARDVSPIVATDPRVPQASRPRLSRQCQVILDRLTQGEATNRELAQIALKYSGRVSDLRSAGYDVRVVSHDHVTGVAVYRLVTP
jgi:hypothetical protein